ncbi:hypothetical protein [Faecalicatena orotica]|uniref:hypothetical protein n=1 Tax=Faecalicatena orotica TaxID=1544 RepID=UPI00321656DF
MKWNRKNYSQIFIAFGIVITLATVTYLLYNVQIQKQTVYSSNTIEIIKLDNKQSMKYTTSSTFMFNKILDYINRYEDVNSLNEHNEINNYDYQININHNNVKTFIEIFLSGNILKVNDKFYNIISRNQLNSILQTAETVSLTITFIEPVEKQTREEITLSSKNNSDAQAIYDIICVLDKYTKKDTGFSEECINIMKSQINGGISYYQVLNSKEALTWMNEIIADYRTQELRRNKNEKNK